MPEKYQRVIYAILITTFVASAIISGTLAWQSIDQVVLSKAMGNNNVPIDIELTLYEKTANGKITENTISETAFYLFKKDGEQIGGKYVTTEEGKIDVTLTYGDYYFEEIKPNVGYTFDEVEGETITKYPFTVTGKETEKKVISAYNIRLENSLLVRKSVKNADDTELTTAQLEQEFYFTITFSDGGSYTYTINEREPKTIKSGETFNLKHGETAVFSNIPVGILYSITETPEEGYIITSNGHRGHITEEGANAEFINTYSGNQYGSITITKEVVYNSIETESTENNEKTNTQEFTFTAIIGEQQETFTLKAGESKTISGIPIGTEYTVTEEDVEGYTSTIKEYKGKVNNTETIELPFTNIYGEMLDEKTGNITITKKVIGENADLTKEFDFEIKFEGENAPENIAFKLKADESKTIENIPNGVKYTINETNSNGYKPKKESVNGIIAGEQTININFENIVPEAEITQTKLSVTKILKGEYLETDKEKEFEFTILIDGIETKFALKAEETKEFEIPVGATYSVCEEDYYQEGYSQKITNGSGIAEENTIMVTATNNYVGEVKNIIKGKKNWEIGENTEITLPETITILLKEGNNLVEQKEIKADENHEWQYEFIAPKYDVEGNEIEYKIEELQVESFIPKYEKYDITNIYVEPIEVELPSIEKIIQGEGASETKFEILLKGIEDSPMPEMSTDNRKIIEIKGSGKTELGKIIFKNPGTYKYTVSELNGGMKGWTYDNTVYNITVKITEEEYKLNSEIIIEKNEENAEEIIFTNTYSQETLGENIIISGEKTWKHGTNEVSNYPETIIVYVYGDGELKVQKQITEADDWKYAFELPKLAEDGQVIEYAIDEAEVPGYNKIIDGYDLTNEYIEKPDTPEETDKPDSNDSEITTNSSTKPNPSTGDNIYFWIVLMVISGTMFLKLTIISRKKGKH